MKNNLAKVFSAELEGINAKLIEVEVDLNVGLHSFNVVGLGDKSLSESRERVNSALKNFGAKPPNRENRRITVNLAPADVKKGGSQYDLAIALGYLLATKQIKEFETANKIFLGELSLDGRIRQIHGSLNIAQMAKEKGFEYLFLPKENANEASAVDGITIIGISSLKDAVDYLEERSVIPNTKFDSTKNSKIESTDFSEIIGQENAKRCMTIAAAGGHNFLMIGPPGVGKSLLASALVGILPDLSREEAIEITKIYSAAGINLGGLIELRPVRSPHQTASLISIVGGGSDPKPGEISLAHHGVLFLDELPEFQKNVLEALRAPMETGRVHVSRAKRSLIFPAKFTLIAAMNPCPCGYFGDEEKECRCGAFEVERYQKKISGPLLDRIDMQIRVSRVKISELRKGASKEKESSKIKLQIESAREKQSQRLIKEGIRTNSEMTSSQIKKYANLDTMAEEFLNTLEKTDLSPRAFYRILKTARTIADLANEESVSAEHLAEAYSYRLKEN